MPFEKTVKQNSFVKIKGNRTCFSFLHIINKILYKFRIFQNFAYSFKLFHITFFFTWHLNLLYLFDKSIKIRDATFNFKCLEFP